MTESQPQPQPDQQLRQQLTIAALQGLCANPFLAQQYAALDALSVDVRRNAAAKDIAALAVFIADQAVERLER